MKDNQSEILQEILKGVERGFRRIHSDLKKELFLQTPFKTGFLRDGDVYQSGQGNEIIQEKTSLKIINSIHYASYVYFGTQKMKGRPWIEKSIEKINPSKILEQEIDYALRKNI